MRFDRASRWCGGALLRVLVAGLLLPMSVTGRAATPETGARTTDIDRTANAPATVPTAAAPAPAPAQAQAAAPVIPSPDSLAASPSSTSDDLAAAREMIKFGDYDHAIERLRAAIPRRHDDPDALRETYLLLIKTYVFMGNDYKFKPQGREMSNLNYRAARELIAECLQNPALSGTEPEPATDYPPEMIGFFSEVRSRLFGGFRVVGLEPPDALVLLDGDTLPTSKTGAQIARRDLPVGEHTVAVRASRFKTQSETITISPNATLERSYRLVKRRGPVWYAGRAVGALGIVGGAIALLGGNKNGETAGPQPLPGAPPPP